MRIRPYTTADLTAIQRIHEQQALGYQLPNLDHPLFITRLVAEDDQGRATQAAFLRLTAEAYLLLDPTCGSPREKWRELLVLHEAVRQDARARGLDDVHAWVPPKLEKRFGRRLMHLGWSKQLWPSYSREL